MRADQPEGRRRGGTDRYSGFDDLRRGESATEYAIRLREGFSGVVVLAPHGGCIEPGTSEIADAVAGGEHTFYAFEGLKPRGNRTLHIASTKFDEPVGLAAACRAKLVLTIHGCAETQEVVFVGSRDVPVRERVRGCLARGGFVVEDRPLPGLRGRHPDNLCNRSKKGIGVQLEVSRGLRKRMLGSLEPGGKRAKTPVFEAFIDAVRRAIGDLEQHIR